MPPKTDLKEKKRKAKNKKEKKKKDGEGDTAPEVVTPVGGLRTSIVDSSTTSMKTSRQGRNETEKKTRPTWC